MAEYAQLPFDADITVYFCETRQTVAAGHHEITKWLLRQYYPSGTSFTDLTNEELIHCPRCRKEGRGHLQRIHGLSARPSPCPSNEADSVPR
jgi:hypothetical protein